MKKKIRKPRAKAQGHTIPPREADGPVLSAVAEGSKFNKKPIKKPDVIR